jgi:HD-GYP domain-containing protein (c-di-GMP phosphodiesterase class II)
MEHDERLVGEARERELQPLSRRERSVAASTGAAFLAAAAAIAVLLPGGSAFDPVTTVALVVLLAVTRRVQFEVGTGYGSADQLVFIPILFLAPLPFVPLLVMAAYLISRVPDSVGRKTHVDRWLYTLGDAWYSIGPVVLVGLLAPGDPQLEYAGVYALAFVAQVLCESTVTVVTDRLAYEMPVADSLRSYAWVIRVDAVLSPIAYVIASVATEANLALLVLAVGPLVWLFRSFSEERKERYAAAIELNQAYRGTVMMLSEVVEAEDNYTADHCRSVVDLASDVAEELALDLKTRQELEIAALLHDVGKIAIPKEILNKPAKLTDEEFALMKTHTIEGQALLDRVGGRLARVGEIVRSCHERWDGRGYPDGIKGEEIPVAARIVFCCDAYSAMTTDRPYRKAMSREAALEELYRNSGTQFEPRVVAALTKVVARAAHERDAYDDALRAVVASQPVPVEGVPSTATTASAAS